jgi:outer membrane protein assembly factor BamA
MSSAQGVANALFLAITAIWVSMPIDASSQARPTGLDVGGLPAINFDADEGFGYGAIAELYQYGDGLVAPYVWTLQPTVFFTTEGRRDLSVFFDAPGVPPSGWRLTAFLGTNKQIATPYYGLGNASPYDETLEADDGPDPYYYRFGRTSHSLTFNLQKDLGTQVLRGLFGGGLVRTTINPFPEGEGGTLYALDVGGEAVREWTNFLRAGLVWDTRDRQTGPRDGTWTEFILQFVDESLGADASYLRWTFTDRRYYSLGDRLVFAHRYLVQGVGADASIHDLSKIQSSFKQQEGLGGSTSARGIARNRFVGRGILVWNSELRWQAIDFRFFGEQSHVVLSSFLDQGRVWEDDVDFGELFSDLHRGYGGGVRLVFGEDFTVAYDFGTSAKTGLQVYIGLGYLY